MPSAWPPWAGPSPWASWAQALPQGQHRKGLSPRHAGPRGSSSRAAVGGAAGAPSPPCHSASTRQRSITVLWGTIKPRGLRQCFGAPRGGQACGILLLLGSPEDSAPKAEKAVPVSPCPLRGITSPWTGSRSCSRAQGVADRQHWGQEGIFPRGRLAPDPGGFLPSSEH